MQHICALNLIITDRFNKRQIRRNAVCNLHRVTITLICNPDKYYNISRVKVLEKCTEYKTSK